MKQNIGNISSSFTLPHPNTCPALFYCNPNIGMTWIHSLLLRVVTSCSKLLSYYLLLWLATHTSMYMIFIFSSCFIASRKKGSVHEGGRSPGNLWPNPGDQRSQHSLWKLPTTAEMWQGPTTLISSTKVLRSTYHVVLLPGPLDLAKQKQKQDAQVNLNPRQISF
jgi:hypothetical protein